MLIVEAAQIYSHRESSQIQVLNDPRCTFVTCSYGSKESPVEQLPDILELEVNENLIISFHLFLKCAAFFLALAQLCCSYCKALMRITTVDPTGKFLVCGW